MHKIWGKSKEKSPLSIVTLEREKKNRIVCNTLLVGFAAASLASQSKVWLG